MVRFLELMVRFLPSEIGLIYIMFLLAWCANYIMEVFPHKYIFPLLERKANLALGKCEQVALFTCDHHCKLLLTDPVTGDLYCLS